MTPAKIAEHCDKARQFYQDKPGLLGQGTADDLYTCIAHLARYVDVEGQLDTFLDKLQLQLELPLDGLDSIPRKP